MKRISDQSTSKNPHKLFFLFFLMIPLADLSSCGLAISNLNLNQSQQVILDIFKTYQSTQESNHF